jgi:AraC-like DNA-binding protein
MAFVRAIVAAYERDGQDPTGLLAQVHIAPNQLNDPHARITAAQMELVSGLAMQALDDEALGWFSRKLPWGSYGMLCRASLTAGSLGLALQRWCRHHRLLTGDITLQLSRSAHLACIRIVEHQPIAPAVRELCLLTLLRYVLGYACWAVDSRISLRSVAFPFAQPPHADAYAALFTAPVQFDAVQTAMTFDAPYLQLPMRRDEAALQTMLQRALPLTVLAYRRDRLLGQRVRQALNSPGSHTADSLATALHTSARTLHRQLREEGSSLQALKDEVRRDNALALLLRTEKPIKQVAQAAGFDNEKSFIRAFKQWTGLSPARFRQTQTHPKLDA